MYLPFTDRYYIISAVSFQLRYSIWILTGKSEIMSSAFVVCLLFSYWLIMCDISKGPMAFEYVFFRFNSYQQSLFDMEEKQKRSREKRHIIIIVAKSHFINVLCGGGKHVTWKRHAGWCTWWMVDATTFPRSILFPFSHSKIKS